MAGLCKTTAADQADAGLVAADNQADGRPANAFETKTMAVYLAPAEYVDSDHAAVTALARQLCADAQGGAQAAKAVYYFVRDLRYEGGDFEDLEIFRASSVLAAGHGYCVGKAALCTALARAAGIPARLGFADVRNHLASPRLLAAMGTDVFAWHGYTQLFLAGRWVSVSPTFDAATCRRANVPPLAFDGEHDALLQSFDGSGATMSYLKQHGTFHDVPARFLAAEMPGLYPFARDHGITRFQAASGTAARSAAAEAPRRPAKADADAQDR
jgi:transglutaminase-like putative cysteine protease